VYHFLAEHDDDAAAKFKEAAAAHFPYCSFFFSEEALKVQEEHLAAARATTDKETDKA